MIVQKVPKAHPFICQAVERHLTAAFGKKVRIGNDARWLAQLIADEINARVCRGDAAKIAELRAVLIEARGVLDGLDELMS